MTWDRVRGAAGALAGQVTLAAGSLVLQVVAARGLGSEGLGHFALMFGYVVMATAVSTGLVGDSLTVLDRRHPAIRSGLLTCAALTIGVAVAGAFLLALPSQGPAVASVLAVATAAFMVADLLRRTLMACLRFWSLVLADGLGLLAAVTLLAVAQVTAGLELGHVVAALAVAQATAGAVAWRCLPREERRPARVGSAGITAVVRFGGWRALQQFVRPTTLNAVRWLVLVTTGVAAVGELEAARVFVAPAMLLVQGLASYLFASYAAAQTDPVRELLRRADHGAAAMLTGCALLAGTAALAAPELGPLLTGDRFTLPTVAVLGWGVYAASCAAVLPYGSLAAVLGAPAQVFLLRLLDAAVALLVTALALALWGMPFAWVPWLLSGGSFLGGYLCRRLLLAPRSAGAAVPRPALTSVGRR